MEHAAVRRFLDGDGRVFIWPKKHADKELVLTYLASKFDVGHMYHEREVNEVLKRWHTFSDWPLLRRELFERGFFDRDREGIAYQRLK